MKRISRRGAVRRAAAIAVPAFLVSAVLAGCTTTGDDASVPDSVACGLATGEKASGEPINIGGVVVNQPGVDFTDITDAAKAYFECVNDNGGINGRPVNYIIKEEQSDPQQVAAVATQLLEDDDVVAMVGNASLLDCTVNDGLYADAGIKAIVAGVPTECFNSPSFAPMNFGPYFASIAAAQALAERGVDKIVVVTADTPGAEFANSGATDYADKEGIPSESLLETVPISDASGLALRLVDAAGPNGGVELNFSPPELIKVFSAIAQQGLIDAVEWSCVSCIDDSIVESLDPAWNGKLIAISEFGLVTATNEDTQLFRDVMAKYSAGTPVGNFAQMGFLAAKFATAAMLALDPADITREGVNQAIIDLEPASDAMLCGPFYYGEGDVHVPNNFARTLGVADGAYTDGSCIAIAALSSNKLDEIRENEKALGIG